MYISVRERKVGLGPLSVAKSWSWESAVFGGRGRICGPVNFGAVKVSKEIAIEAMCNEFSEGT